MSDLSDIVKKGNDLMESVSGLLDAELLDTLIDLGRELGMQNEIKTGISALLQFFTLIEEGVKQVEDPVRQVTALQGLFAMLSPLGTGLSGAVRSGAEGMGRALGGNRFTPPAEIEEALQVFEGFFKNGENVLSKFPDISQVERLLGEIDKSKQRLKSFESSLSS